MSQTWISPVHAVTAAYGQLFVAISVQVGSKQELAGQNRFGADYVGGDKVAALTGKPRLVDIQISMSGQCSSCSDLFLTHSVLFDEHAANKVKNVLERIFQNHMQKSHPDTRSPHD